MLSVASDAVSATAYVLWRSRLPATDRPPWSTQATGHERRLLELGWPESLLALYSTASGVMVVIVLADAPPEVLAAGRSDLFDQARHNSVFVFVTVALLLYALFAPWSGSLVLPLALVLCRWQGLDVLGVQLCHHAFWITFVAILAWRAGRASIEWSSSHEL